MDKSILKYLATTYKQDIKPPYDILFESYGIDVLCDLSDYLGGEVYIPNIRTMLNECIIQDILQNKEKRSVRELSQRYGISARQIYNIRNSAKIRSPAV